MRIRFHYVFDLPDDYSFGDVKAVHAKVCDAFLRELGDRGWVENGFTPEEPDEEVEP